MCKKSIFYSVTLDTLKMEPICCTNELFTQLCIIKI